MTTTHVADPARVPDAPLVEPGTSAGLLDVFRHRYLLRLLVQKELRARYSGSALGMLWSYIKPLVRFLMYFLVMGYVLQLHKSIENFAMHIFAGMVMVHYFTETFSSGTKSIVRNKGLVTKMDLPREMFPVASMLVSAYHTFPQILILTVAATFIGWSPDLVGFAAGILGFSIVAVFGIALALFFSAANVFFRDFGNIIETFSIFVMWSTPMIYPYVLISNALGGTWLGTAYLCNPVANAVLLFQRCFWTPTTEDPAATVAEQMPDYLMTRGLVVLGACLVLLALGQVVFSRLEGKFAERL